MRCQSFSLLILLLMMTLRHFLALKYRLFKRNVLKVVTTISFYSGLTLYLANVVDKVETFDTRTFTVNTNSIYRTCMAH